MESEREFEPPWLESALWVEVWAEEEEEMTREEKEEMTREEVLKSGCFEAET
jgi:hypothetical protein